VTSTFAHIWDCGTSQSLIHVKLALVSFWCYREPLKALKKSFSILLCFVCLFFKKTVWNQVIPSAPAYVLDSEESYTASVTTSFHPGRVASGNLTLEIYARPVNSSLADFRFIKQEFPPWVG
jgi:hypothetical protein